MKRIPALVLLCSGIFIGFLCSLLVKTAYSDQATVDYNHPVAQVGNTVITRGQLAEQAIFASGRRLIIGDLQTQALVAEAARRARVTVSDAEVSQEVDNMLAFARDAMASTKYLDVPRSVWEGNARMVLLAQKMIGITVTEDEARNYYMKNPSAFVQPASAKLICISTQTRTKANEVLKRLKDGEDPSVLASLYNYDQALKERKGDINWVTPRSLGPDAASQIFDGGLKPGQWTDVITYKYYEPGRINTGSGIPEETTLYSIFFIKDMRPTFTPKFTEVKDAAIYITRLAKYKAQAPKWLASLAGSIGKEWSSSVNLYDPNASLKSVPLDPDIYSKQPANTVPTVATPTP